MKGIEVYDIGKWRFREDLEVPEPQKGEARIKVLAAGICGTDIHINNGDPSLTHLLRIPFILGHEFCGLVDRLGPETEGPETGTYVSAEMHEWCGDCPACLSGAFHACQNTKIHGLNLDGCFAEYVVVPVRNLVLLPKDLPVKAGAILDPLGNAVHTALKVPPKDKNVAVIGYGPIGAMSVEVLLFEGAKNIWITDVNPKALERARSWVQKKGCQDRVRVLSTAGTEREKTIQSILEDSQGGVDVVLEISGHPNGINDGLKIVRAAGDYVQLGLPSGEVTIHDFGPNIVFKGIRIHAIIGREVFATWEKMLELHQRGFDIAGMVTGEYPIEEFGTALNRFIEGEEQKVVLRMSGTEERDSKKG
ncbi:MAG TPA: hypothetical protein ENK02_02170 [Planctomycetes bacterium]|nr:hypothetical protein [Planctomycetota bacterium]